MDIDAMNRLRVSSGMSIQDKACRLSLRTSYDAIQHQQTASKYPYLYTTVMQRINL